MSEKCGNVLEEEGQRLLCQLPEGHSKHIPHESGDWEWWDEMTVEEILSLLRGRSQ